MLATIIVTSAILIAFGEELGSRWQLRLIAPRPYNNRYNDASGARDGHFI
jgi:hypothetical protein